MGCVVGAPRLGFTAPRLPRWARAALLAVIALGVAWRFWRVLGPEGSSRLLRNCDGAAYWDLAKSLASGNGLTHTDPALVDKCAAIEFTGLGPSHHYSPLLPMLEAGMIQMFGPSTATLQATVLLLGVLALGVAYWTTRDLLGHAAGLVVAAWAAADWSLRSAGSDGYSEPLLLVTFCLTLWAILRSLEDERHILWAGLFAALGYLSKASLGWFFLVAGLGGLAWRLLHRGKGVLANRWYLGAIAVFGAIFAAWALRNVRLFWDGSPDGLLNAWQTSAYNSHVFGEAFRRPGKLLEGAAVRLPMLLWGMMVPVVAFWGPLRGRLRSWREEATSGLLLAAGLMFVLGLLFAAAFDAAEGNPLGVLWMDPLRYVMAAQLPLFWLALGAPGIRTWQAGVAVAAAIVQGYVWVLA